MVENQKNRLEWDLNPRSLDCYSQRIKPGPPELSVWFSPSSDLGPHNVRMSLAVKVLRVLPTWLYLLMTTYAEKESNLSEVVEMP